jgi:hypothetical protein
MMNRKCPQEEYLEDFSFSASHRKAKKIKNLYDLCASAVKYKIKRVRAFLNPANLTGC